MTTYRSDKYRRKVLIKKKIAAEAKDHKEYERRIKALAKRLGI